MGNVPGTLTFVKLGLTALMDGGESTYFVRVITHHNVSRKIGGFYV
ncbi:MAG: hypothetical protein ABFD79_16400 [Phycisphaerales bacterium]